MELLKLIKNDKNSVLENSRICGCFILKSYSALDDSSAADLFTLCEEGANQNFTIKSTNPRVFFVDLRVQLLNYLIFNFLKTENFTDDRVETIFKSVLNCLNDYSRNQKGKIILINDK